MYVGNILTFSLMTTGSVLSPFQDCYINAYLAYPTRQMANILHNI